MENEIKKAFKSIHKKIDKIDLSEKISSNIEELMNPGINFQKRLPAFVKLALISIMVFITVLLFNPLKKNRELPVNNLKRENIVKMNVQYATISGKEAKKYYFKSDNNNKLIVWIQKKGE